MNENFTDTEMLIRYLDGELVTEQAAALQKRISNDTTLREELERLSLAKEAILSYGLKNKISTIHTQMMQELKTTPAPQTGIVRTLVRYSMRIAAAAVLLIGGYGVYQYFTASPQKLFNESFQAFNLHETRGATTSALEPDFKKGNMLAVIQKSDTLKTAQTQDYFFAGNAYLSLHQPFKAMQAFNQVLLQNKLNNTHYFEDDATWYLALSYLANEEPLKAIPLFEQIYADVNHPYHKYISKWYLIKLHRFSEAK